MFEVKNIIRIIEEKGYTCSSIEKSLGFGNGAIRRWGKNSPSINKLYKLSDFLNVSMNYLLGENEHIAASQPILVLEKESNDTTKEENVLFENFKKLSKEGQRKLLNNSAVLLQKEKEEKEEEVLSFKVAPVVTATPFLT